MKLRKRIKRSIAFCGLVCLGGAIASFPGAAQLPRFEEPRSPAPKPVAQPIPSPTPKPPEPVSPPSDAVTIEVPPPSTPPEPVSPPSDAVPIEVPPPSTPPEPVSPPSDAVPIEVPPPSTPPEPVSPPPSPVPVEVPTPIVVPSPSPSPRPIPVPPPSPPRRVNDTTPPLPEQRQEAVAAIAPANGFVSVKLINRTLATIGYEIIGDTTLRTLPGKSEVTLRGLMTPVNVTFRRDDGGFLLVQTTVNEEGILELTMTETNVFDLDKTSLLIEENGRVFLN